MIPEHFGKPRTELETIIFKEPTNISTRFVFNIYNLSPIGGWIHCSKCWDGLIDIGPIRII